MKNITVHELHDILEKDQTNNLVLVDVRTPLENKEVRIPQAKNIPLDQLEQHKDELKTYSTVFVHCRSGGRSSKACQKLKEMGIENVVNITGGILAWEAEGFGVQKDARLRFPLIQQVHIVAGLLILLGILLGWLVHPGWIGLSGFVGAGLLFSGLTGHCGMAMLLSRMPWNL